MQPQMMESAWRVSASIFVHRILDGVAARTFGIKQTHQSGDVNLLPGGVEHVLRPG